MTTELRESLSVLSRIKLFLALSRTPHGVLDLATPMVAAMIDMVSIIVPRGQVLP